MHGKAASDGNLCDPSFSSFLPLEINKRYTSSSYSQSRSCGVSKVRRRGEYEEGVKGAGRKEGAGTKGTQISYWMTGCAE